MANATALPSPAPHPIPKSPNPHTNKSANEPIFAPYLKIRSWGSKADQNNG
jgi:hypothetical protein